MKFIVTQVMVMNHLDLQHLAGKLRVDSVPFRWKRVTGGYTITSTRGQDLSKYLPERRKS